MTAPQKTQSEAEEVTFISNESLGLVAAIESCTKDSGVEDKETLRLMALPMLYSAWERFFHLGTTICIKSIQAAATPCGKYSSSMRALLVLNAPFHKSFLKKVQNDDPTVGVMAEYFSNIDKWHLEPFNQGIDPETVIVTRSNVNKEVVELNARALGIDKVRKFSRIDFSRLGELVERRNGIGHGKTLKAPGEKDLEALIEYTKKLIQSYRDVVLAWLKKFKRKGC